MYTIAFKTKEFSSLMKLKDSKMRTKYFLTIEECEIAIQEHLNFSKMGICSFYEQNPIIYHKIMNGKEIVKQINY